MKRRLLIILALAAALAGSASSVSAIGSQTTGNGYWGCIISGEIDQSVCLKEPRLPNLPQPPL